jgi:hypothetical protein
LAKRDAAGFDVLLNFHPDGICSLKKSFWSFVEKINGSPLTCFDGRLDIHHSERRLPDARRTDQYCACSVMKPANKLIKLVVSSA